MDDISGGTFTLTNAGPFGTLFTIPVINQPQVAILATDGVRKKPVVVELPDGTDAIAIHPVGNLVLSFDHRAIDGAYASAFMRAVKESLEDPGLVHRAMTLRIRWLGRVRYQDALALQRALFRGGAARRLAAPARTRPRLHHGRQRPAGARAGRPGRRSARSWSRPTGAATSPTTARAS